MTRFRLGVTFALWAVVVLALAGSDAQPQVVLLSGLVVAACAASFSIIDLLRGGAALTWARAPEPVVISLDDESVIEIARQIRTSHRSSSALRDTLLAVVDQRLVDRHGIDRAVQPEAALAELGPGLAALVRQPRNRISVPEDLDQLLDEIEAM